MSNFNMPPVVLGDWVYFYYHVGAPPTVALVSAVSSRTVTLWAVCPGYGGTEKPSVHHLTDPGVEEFKDWKAYGFWDYKPRDPKAAILSEKVAFLEKRVAELEGKRPK